MTLDSFFKREISIADLKKMIHRDLKAIATGLDSEDITAHRHIADTLSYFDDLLDLIGD